MEVPERNYDADVEIVGLNLGSNERSCTVHDVCGESVVVGDYIRFRLTVLDGMELIYNDGGSSC